MNLWNAFSFTLIFYIFSHHNEKIAVKIYAATNLKIIDSVYLIGVVLSYRYL